MCFTIVLGAVSMVRAVLGGVVSQGSVSGRVMAMWKPAVRELLLAVAALFAGFWYLEVPVVNAALFAVAIVLQGALGAVALSRVLGGAATSLLTVLGPGLILGGALAFVLFQVVGRGALGLGAVTLAGAASALALSRSSHWQPLPSNAPWIIGQVLGLAALAMTWEFGELLPVAAAFYALGFLTGRNPRLPSTVRWAAAVAAAALIATPLVTRQDYWWLVTDDYRFFEVLSTHITRSGPFADWGAMNWSRYHWLSYGWSGLLNELGGQPEPFTTLTRVMPLTYSIALAASLIQLTRHVTTTTPTNALTLTPAWAIIALNPLDWSGTSTAGIYAVIGAFLAVSLFAWNERVEFRHRLVTYSLFLLVGLLTKAHSALAIGLSVLVFEVSRLLLSLKVRRPGRWILLVATLIGIATYPLLYLGSKFDGGFELVAANPALGDLAKYGSVFALISQVISNLPLLAILALALVYWRHDSRRGSSDTSTLPLMGLVPLLALGITLNVFVTGPANLFEYLSRPMIYLSALAITTSVSSIALSEPRARDVRLVFLSGAVGIFGFVWRALELYENSWDRLGKSLFNWNPEKVTLLKYVSDESTFGAGTLLMILVIVGLTNPRILRPKLVLSCLIPLVVLQLLAYQTRSANELSRIRTEGEIFSNIGVDSARDVAVWLRENTNEADTVATNFLYDYQTGGPLSDFSLGSWSQREFLVLGPNLFSYDYELLQFEYELSIYFGEQPNEETAEQLRIRGVRWFVVDKYNTQFQDWQTTTDVVYENERFIVVRL